jgi:hypothetical protein
MRPTALMEGRCKTGTEAYSVSAPVRTAPASRQPGLITLIQQVACAGPGTDTQRHRHGVAS